MLRNQIILKMEEPIWRSAKAKVNILWSEEFPFQVAQDFTKLSFVKDEHIKNIPNTRRKMPP